MFADLCAEIETRCFDPIGLPVSFTNISSIYLNSLLCRCIPPNIKILKNSLPGTGEL